MGQLLRLVIRDPGYDASVRHLTGVRGEDAGDIRPDLDFVGVERGSEEGCAVIGATTSQGGRRAIGGATDEASEDHRVTSIEVWLHLLQCQLTGMGAVGTRIAKPAIGRDDAIGPDMN